MASLASLKIRRATAAQRMHEDLALLADLMHVELPPKPLGRAADPELTRTLTDEHNAECVRRCAERYRDVHEDTRSRKQRELDEAKEARNQQYATSTEGSQS